MSAFNDNPNYIDLNTLFTETPTNKSGLTAQQFNALVENTIYLKVFQSLLLQVSMMRVSYPKYLAIQLSKYCENHLTSLW